MKIDWLALLSVFAVSLGAVLGMVVLFSFGLRGVALRKSSRGLGAIVATLCFGACAAVVGFGIYLIVAA